MSIHESSPLGRGASLLLRESCASYTATYFQPNDPTGQMVRGYRNEDLEEQTFADESFDLVVTQDVMEHVLDPDRAFAEIARTLRPGGAHVFTTPLVNRNRPSEVWARRLDDGSIQHEHPPEYHGNPLGDGGSLVSMHWGFDIVEHIHRASGLFSLLAHIDDLDRGIRGRLNEVVITFK
jgi:SAM-dependent methyltransferase